MDYSNQKQYFETAYITGSDHWTHVAFNQKGSDLSKYLKPGAMILDLGSGRGQFPFELVQDGYRTIGLDYVKSIVEKNNEEVHNRKLDTSMRFIEGDVFNIPFTDGSFDAVTDVGLLQHIHPEDWLEYRMEVNRVLKPGGYYFLIALSRDTKSFLTWHPKREPFGTYDREGVQYHFFTREELTLLFDGTFTLLSERTDVVTLHHDPTSFFVMVFQKPEAK
jgi:ubiquinone/menaquinone biosynthesis C-methylase UbiE